MSNKDLKNIYKEFNLNLKDFLPDSELKMKYDEYDIQTACNIAVGDDETTGKEVIRILKIITKEEKKEDDKV